MKSDTAVADEIRQLEILLGREKPTAVERLLVEGALLALRWTAGSRRRPSTAVRRGLTGQEGARTK